MKILEIKNLAIPEIKTIKFARFRDQRGYFTEQFKKSDISQLGIKSLENVEFVQGNESYSKKGAIRGMHFQWNPYMGKLVRILSGHMVDLALDIRKESPTYGKIIGHEMSNSKENDYDEWIWIPPGFAHGFFFQKNSSLEYLCSGAYNSNCEFGISPLSKDINWEICDKKIKYKFDCLTSKNMLITEKDRNGYSLEDWKNDLRSNNFMYSHLNEEKHS